MTDPRTTSGDPNVEPPNSTVKDWFGQEAAADEALADEALAEAGGDAEEAESRFEGQSHHAEAERGEHENRSAAQP